MHFTIFVPSINIQGVRQVPGSAEWNVRLAEQREGNWWKSGGGARVTTARGCNSLPLLALAEAVLQFAIFSYPCKEFCNGKRAFVELEQYMCLIIYSFRIYY